MPLVKKSTPCSCKLPFLTVGKKRNILPVNNPLAMQVLYCRQNLSGVSPYFLFHQPLFVTNSVQEVPTEAQLHHHVIGVVGLQGLIELNNVGVLNHLVYPRLTLHVF